MGNKPVSKKLKRGALISNIIQEMAFLFFGVIFFSFICYKDYLILEYIPVKHFIFAGVIIVIVTIIPFVIKWGKISTIASIVLSILITIVLVAAGIYGLVFDSQIKNFIDKTDNAIEKVVENAKLSTDEYGVYVLKTDSAEEIKDVVDYIFGYNPMYSAEDANTVITAIKNEISKTPNIVAYEDPAKLAQGLLDGQCGAIILNQSLVEFIESAGDDSDDEEKNGDFADFSSRIRCIYTVNIKNQVVEKEDKGGITKECFNVYISGIDTEGSVTAKSRSDVNIIMSVNPVTHQILLISTPRDYYVPLSISNGVRDKLTHAGNYGIDVSMETLELLYETEIDYFVRMNFTGFEHIIDALGGIDVESEYAFSTHGYSFSEGLNENLSGIEALWFARERKSFAEGDRQRGKDQMAVIEAVIEKCQSSALLNNYTEILDNISESFQTNITKKSIKELVKFQLNESPDWEILSYSAEGHGESNYTYSVPSARAYVMVPDEESVAEIKQLLIDNKNNQIIKETESAKER